MFFELFTGFFIVINFILILPFTIEAPKLLYLVSRMIFASAGASIAHVINGFDIYDDLTPEEVSLG